MSVYPGKKTASFGFNTKKLDEAGNAQGTFDGMPSGAVGSVATALGSAVGNIGMKNRGYGISHQGVGAATAGGALKGAGAGYEIGKNFGPQAAIIGAGVGLVGGAAKSFFGARDAKEQAESDLTQIVGDTIGETSRRSRKKYGTLQGYQARSYAPGGRIDAPRSVILGGKLHKDGGNPIIIQHSRQKIAETEREELLMSYEHTQKVDALIEKYEKTKSNATLEKLGREIQRLLLNETTDNSGKFTD